MNKLPIITGATLLSAKLADKLEFRLKNCPGIYWLKSDAFFGYFMDLSCKVVKVGGENLSDIHYVKPALIISDLNGNKIGDQFEINGINFEIISNKRALCLEFIGKSAYYKNPYKENTTDSKGQYEDSFKLSYSGSDIEKFINDWYQDKIKPALQESLTDLIITSGNIRESYNLLEGFTEVPVTVIFNDTEIDLVLDADWCDEYFEKEIKNRYKRLSGKPVFSSFDDFVDNDSGVLWDKKGEDLYNKAKKENAIIKQSFN